jgi:hypothetical protein
VKRPRFALYRILEKQGNVMVDAGTWKKLGSFATTFAFQGFYCRPTNQMPLTSTRKMDCTEAVPPVKRRVHEQPGDTKTSNKR